MADPTPYWLSVVPLLAMLLWAAVEDWRARRIRNWLTFSMVLSGFFQTFMHVSQVGPWQSLAGMTVGFALGMLLFPLGAVGGGDVKLLAGIGAWFGTQGVLEIFCGQAVIGMLLVLVHAAAQGRLQLLFRNTAALAINLIHLNQVGLAEAVSTGQSCKSVHGRLPFAVPVLLAVVGLILAGAVR